MTFGTKVTTITQDYIVPEVIDNILDGNVLTMRMLTKQRPAKGWGKVSGESIKIPIKYQKSTSGGWYENFDPFAVNQTNVRVHATYRMRQLYYSVPLSGAQLSGNMGESRVIDLLTTEMGSVANDMLDTFGDGLYSDGTGSANKQLTGLDAAVDNGTTATYAGLLRATYTTWVSDTDASANAVTRAEIADSFAAAKHGSDTPTLGVTTPAIWHTIEGLAMATMNWNNPQGNGGFAREYGSVSRAGAKRGVASELGSTAIFFRGVPIVEDEKCTAGRFYWLNENHMGIARWPYPDLPGYSSKSNYHGFCWTGLKMPTNQDVTVGQFLFYGQLVCDSCRTQAVMTNKT